MIFRFRLLLPWSRPNEQDGGAELLRTLEETNRLLALLVAAVEKLRKPRVPTSLRWHVGTPQQEDPK